MSTKSSGQPSIPTKRPVQALYVISSPARVMLENIKKYHIFFENGYDSDGALSTLYDCIDKLDQIFDKEELPVSKTDDINNIIMDIFCDSIDEVYIEAEPVMIHNKHDGGDNNGTGSEVLLTLEE